MDKRYEPLAHKIASEITFSNSPGKTMRKWREIFSISQMELSRFLGINPSTISDYEGERRSNPGINVVKRFVSAIIEIDLARGGTVVSRYTQELPTSDFFYVHEFASSINGVDFAKLIEGKAIANEELLDRAKVYGYTFIRSLRAIMEMQATDFPNLFGNTRERAFIFSDVSTGRSPMVVVRVNSIKPSIIVFHDLKENKVDKLAIALAQKEKIPLLLTYMPIDKIEGALKKL
ncbi:MAG: transcriptional regulator [Candidatus Micrarchaeia archaeon]